MPNSSLHFLTALSRAGSSIFLSFCTVASPLYRDIQKGTFTPADELENLQEERRLLELLELKHTEI